jgi:Lon protease-like protein
MTDRELPLFPLEQVVLFPGMPLPLRIFEERYKVMIGSCQVTDQLFGVLLIRSGREVGDPAEPERVGCTARMHRVDRMPDGQMMILCVGEQRFRLRGAARAMPEGYLVGDVQLLEEQPAEEVPADLTASVTQEFEKYQHALLAAMPRASTPPELPREPRALSYRVGAMLAVHPRERQHLLELNDAATRLRQELAILRRENRPVPQSIGPFSPN